MHQAVYNNMLKMLLVVLFRVDRLEVHGKTCQKQLGGRSSGRLGLQILSPESNKFSRNWERGTANLKAHISTS